MKDTVRFIELFGKDAFQVLEDQGVSEIYLSGALLG